MQHGSDPYAMYGPRPAYRPPPRRHSRFPGLGCFNTTVKFLFCLANTAIAVLGLALLVIGAVNRLPIKFFELPLPENLSMVAMVGGGAIMLVACLGCYGAKNNSRCLLISYGAIVMFLLAAQLGVSIYLTVTDNPKEEFKTGLASEFAKAKDSEQTEDSAIPQIQRTLECCGIDGPDDFKKHGDWPKSLLPFCCKKGQPCEEPAFKTGCAEAAENAYNMFINISSGVGFVVAVAELAAAVVAFKLASDMG